MAAHSSALAWRIRGTAEPGGLLSMGSHRVGHNWSDLAAVLGIANCTYVSVSVQFSHSVRSDSLPMDCSKPGLPVHHQVLGFTQTHVHWVSDAIQPSHPLSSPSPPTFNLSKNQSLFQCQFFATDGQSIGVSASAPVLLMNIQDWFPLDWTGWISFLSQGLSRVSSNTTVQKHQLFCAWLSL